MRSALFVLALGLILPLHTQPAAAATERVVYSFCSRTNCTDGQYPWGGVLSVGSDLYTTTSIGGGNGTNTGTLVAVNQNTGVPRFVFSFATHGGAGAQPRAGLIAVDDTLYGMTISGGRGDGGNGAGVLYTVASGTKKAKGLLSFCRKQNCTDGAWPTGNLLGFNGVLYGTTLVGGGGTQGCSGPYPGCGTAFSFDPATGRERILYRFCALNSCADGSRPTGSLIEMNGKLYGTAAAGGVNSSCNGLGQGCGTVFALDPTKGTETVLYAFTGGVDGAMPANGLLNVNGTLYGVAQAGGNCHYGSGCGTVFSIDPSTGTLQLVHSFQHDGKDGEYPAGGLIEMNGKLYGTTRNGGAHGYGTVFSIDTKTGTEEIVYAFCSVQRCNDGAAPYAGLTAIGGTLYGTTEGGGTGDPNYVIGGGTIFAITP